jgi:hypothetical protein
MYAEHEKINNRECAIKVYVHKKSEQVSKYVELEESMTQHK